jgi:hypothetical protein
LGKILKQLVIITAEKLGITPLETVKNAFANGASFKEFSGQNYLYEKTDFCADNILDIYFICAYATSTSCSITVINGPR